ncbi:MAG: DUF4040 domain-containing protein [Cyanobacteria bacterium P01_A01_bin.83]
MIDNYDNYTYVIVALLPLVSLMLVFQTNPYQALVVRAILGAVAALVYAVLGGADVALTEALVGTMLAITLYVVAVRSSLVVRLGVLKEMKTETENYFPELITSFRKVAQQHYLKLEIVEYQDLSALKQALLDKEVHATCIKQETNTTADLIADNDTLKTNVEQIYKIAIRVRRLFEIWQQELIFPETILEYAPISQEKEKH